MEAWGEGGLWGCMWEGGGNFGAFSNGRCAFQWAMRVAIALGHELFFPIRNSQLTVYSRCPQPFSTVKQDHAHDCSLNPKSQYGNPWHKADEAHASISFPKFSLDYI